MFLNLAPVVLALPLSVAEAYLRGRDKMKRVRINEMRVGSRSHFICLLHLRKQIPVLHVMIPGGRLCLLF